MSQSAFKKQRTEESRAFQATWTDNYAFISTSDGLPLCIICKDKLSSNKKSNVERHFTTKHNSFANKYPIGDARKKAVGELLQKHKMETKSLNTWRKTASTTTSASFAVANEIVHRGKPFTDGEYVKECFLKASPHLFNDFANKANITQKIKDMPLSADTIRERALTMSADVSSQQVNDMNSSDFISIACDESCDIKDIEQLVLLGRYISSTGPREELIGILPLKGQTRGEDIFAAVDTCLSEKHINKDKIVSIATDGAPSMVGCNNGFVSQFERTVKQNIIKLHCIIHQEALAANSFPPEFQGVMDLVVKIVNTIIAKPLSHRQFRQLLEELQSEYSDLLLYNKVRWLSKGKVLKRFAECFEEINDFLNRKNIIHPELNDTNWLQKFYYLVDMTTHLNNLNQKLQGKGNTAISLLEEVLAFERKLNVFLSDIESGAFVHFPALKDFQEKNKCEVGTMLLGEVTRTIQSGFRNRFQDLRKERESLNFMVRPLDADVSKLNFAPFTTIDRANFELELADIKDKELWTAKLKILVPQLEELERKKAELAEFHKWSEIRKLDKPDQLIFETWNALPNTFKELKKYAFGLLSIFGSTYLCEQMFSNLNYIKNKRRNQLNDDSLDACMRLRTTTYVPRIEELSKRVQTQKSH